MQAYLFVLIYYIYRSSLFVFICAFMRTKMSNQKPSDTAGGGVDKEHESRRGEERMRRVYIASTQKWQRL